MRSITIAILSTWLLSAAPAQADGWCWASRLTCPDCEARQTTPRERWNPEPYRADAYHEIFGDGPGPRRGGGRRRRKKAAPKAAAAPAATAAPTAPPADAAPAAPPADAAPPPPADGAAQK